MGCSYSWIRCAFACLGGDRLLQLSRCNTRFSEETKKPNRALATAHLRLGGRPSRKVQARQFTWSVGANSTGLPEPERRNGTKALHLHFIGFRRPRAAAGSRGKGMRHCVATTKGTESHSNAARGAMSAGADQVNARKRSCWRRAIVMEPSRPGTHRHAYNNCSLWRHLWSQEPEP